MNRRFALWDTHTLAGLWVVTVAVLTCAVPCQAAKFALVKDGKPEVEIVYANEPSDYPVSATVQTKRFDACIEDFQDVVKRMSGADIRAMDAKDAGKRPVSNTIQIGLTPAARKAGLAKRVARLKPHSLLIHSDPRKKVLYLVGSTLEGSGHAIYEFLETMGCRWYMPGAFGEELPKMADVKIGKMDIVREPDFELRAIQLRAAGSAASGTKTRSEVMEWMRRNKFGGSGPSRGHQFATLIPKARYWKTHPEYYSLRDGKRRASHLCMSNPEVLDAAEEHLIEHFTKNPRATGYPVALADGAQYCECPGCTKACDGDARSIMPLYLSFTKKLFDRVDKKFPGREFQYGFYVYSNLMQVPKGQIPKQLAPYIAPLGYDAFHTAADPKRYLNLSVANDWSRATLDRLEADPRSYAARAVHDVIVGWSSGTKNVYFRDYDPSVTFAQNMPLVRTYQLAVEIPWHKEIGVRGYTPEATANSWFTSGINFWVRSRYYWDASSDIKVIMQEYCRGMFGSAWEPMYGFLDALARRTVESPAFRHGDHVLARLYSVPWVNDLSFYLDEAEKRAVTEKEKSRVNMWRLCQQHMLKYLNVRNAESRGDFEDAAALGDDYLRFLDYISTVNPHFVDHRWYVKREFSMQKMVPLYTRYAARLNGTEGRMIMALPTRWFFKHDPAGVGIKEQWYKFAPVPEHEIKDGPELDVQYPPMPGWRLQSTARSWQTSKEDYNGYNWYRTQSRIPAQYRGGKVSMLVTGIFGHMDFFINGKRVTWMAQSKSTGGKKEEVNHLDLGHAWSWNYNESFEVAIENYLEFGEVNTFAFRSRDKWNWGGIYKRVQLIVPLGETAIPSIPAKRCDCR